MARKDANKGKREVQVERRIQAYELRKQGFTYDEIGAALGVSGKTAHLDIHSVYVDFHEQLQISAAEYVALEIDRLDMAQQALAPHLPTGDPAIVREWRMLGESRRKLLGLDAPTKIAATNPDGTPAAYAELRMTVLALLPMEARIALADQLDKVIDVTATDRPDESA
jgi:hypothetical protein